MFHPWSKNRPLASKIPNAVINLIEIPKFNSELSKSTWKSISDKLTVPIVKFLTGVDHSVKKKEITQMN